MSLWPVGRERILFGEPVVSRAYGKQPAESFKVGFASIGHSCGTPPHSPCLAGSLEALPHLTSLQLEAEATQAQDSPKLLLKAAGGRGRERFPESPLSIHSLSSTKGHCLSTEGPWKEASQGARQQDWVSSSQASGPSKQQGRDRQSTFRRLAPRSRQLGACSQGTPRQQGQLWAMVIGMT